MSFDTPHESILSVCPDLKARYIHVNGLAKGYAMTGWRVGYMAGPFEVAKLVKSLQSHSSTCIPPFIEKAAEWAIPRPSVMEHKIESLSKRRDLVIAELDKVKDIAYIKPPRGLYIFVDIRKHCLVRRDMMKLTLKFAEVLLENEYVAVVPGEAFQCPGYLRFSYASSEESIKDGVARLQRALISIQ